MGVPFQQVFRLHTSYFVLTLPCLKRKLTLGLLQPAFVQWWAGGLLESYSRAIHSLRGTHSIHGNRTSVVMAVRAVLLKLCCAFQWHQQLCKHVSCLPRLLLFAGMCFPAHTNNDATGQPLLLVSNEDTSMTWIFCAVQDMYCCIGSSNCSVLH